jgi:hypothetical protein
VELRVDNGRGQNMLALGGMEATNGFVRAWANRLRRVEFNRLVLPVSALLLLSSLAGCTYAYNERAVNSPDWKYGVTCFVRGSYGRSYDANTKKVVVVSINSLAADAKERSEIEQKTVYQHWRSDHLPGQIVLWSDPLLFRSTNRIKGHDVEWSAEWGDQDELTLHFFDSEAGNMLRTMHFRFDAAMGRYAEDLTQPH